MLLVIPAKAGMTSAKEKARHTAGLDPSLRSRGLP